MHECGYHHPLGCPPRHGTEHRPCRRERRGGADGAGTRQRGVEGSVGRQLGRKRSIFHRLVFQPSMAGGEPHHVLVRHRPRARRTRSLARHGAAHLTPIVAAGCLQWGPSAAGSAVRKATSLRGTADRGRAGTTHDDAVARGTGRSGAARHGGGSRSEILVIGNVSSRPVDGRYQE